MIKRYLNHLLQKGFLYLILISLPFGFLNAQQTKRDIESNSGDLILFAKQKGDRWKLEKLRADSLAGILKIPVSYTDNTGRVIILQRLGYRNKPVYYSTDNLTAATTISVDKLWSDDNVYPSLNGEGIDINIWDGGSILTTHQEFQFEGESRILMRDRFIPISNHSTHIAGSIGAIGVNAEATGMAGKSTIYGWDMSNDIAEMSIVGAEGALVSNHSYGPLCGWYYNSTTDKWYWYGDISISTVEDYEFGFYNQTSADLDYIACFAPDYLIVKSAGNDRNDAPAEQPVTHYVWDDNWISVNDVVHNPDGGIDGYDCLSPMAVAKNILTIGAVDDVKNMTAFSAFGPTDDGRIKPDVTANGKDLYSSFGSATDAYAYYDGTSMAAATTTGAIALVNQLQEMIQPGVKLASSTLKGLLIHTAEEAGSNAGPDYIFGWGILNIKAACDLLFNNYSNGGINLREGVISQGESIIIPIETSDSSPFLKITLCWTDPPGVPTDPALNSHDPKLINDINIELENISNQSKYYPWVLDAENPSYPATKGINHIDNIEQIYLPNPGTGNFLLEISHSGILSGDAQNYSLLISGSSTPTDLFPPWGLNYVSNESSVLLKWNHPEFGVPIHYNVYRDDTFLAQIADTFYFDSNVITDELYKYYVKAVYELDNDETESIRTNCITACPRAALPLPFIEDFENMPTDVLIKNNIVGWRWGDSDSLSCYYLDFSDNETNFIGIDSYTFGHVAHVMDIAESIPLRLAEYTDVTLSFEYLLNTDIYDAIDELHVVYKLPGDEEWTDWVNLPRTYKFYMVIWESKTFPLPEEAYVNGTQIGFYFDDCYAWGMGAGIDNIEIKGTPIRTADFAVSSLIAPVSSCTLSEKEPVIVAIRNAGTQAALPGDIVNIQMELSTGIVVTDILTLSETLSSGEILEHQLSEELDLSAPGSYIFDFTISSSIDHNSINDHLESSIEVFGFPTAQILNQNLTFCEDDPPEIVQVSPAGGVLSGPGISGLYFSPVIAGIGSHPVTYSYTDPNGCEASVTVWFVVNALPQPVILNSEVTFCINEPSVIVQVSPTGGTLSGPGISGLNFNPASAGVGNHTITYSYTDINGCSASVTRLFVVNALPLPAILNSDVIFCIDEPSVIVQVSPTGGTLSGPGISGLNFNPASAGVGNHTITYSYTDINGCSASVTRLFVVNALPQPAILNSDVIFCIDEPSVIVQVSPTGGTLSGPGISGLYFNPSVAGVGSHSIIYSYTDLNGCDASATRLFVVNALPQPAILNSDITFCIDEPSVNVQVSPAGGILSGPGISGLDFNPSVAGVGSHSIIYSYTDLNGCDASVSRLFVVNTLPKPAILNQDLAFCEGDPQVLVEVSPTGGTLSGPGISGLYFNPSIAGIGSHYITYSYTDPDGCTDIIESQVIVSENPVVDLGPDQIIDLNETIQLIPSGNGFSFLWYDGSTASQLIISAEDLGIGIYDIWVIATSIDLCSTTDYMVLTIDMLDNVQLGNKVLKPLIYPNPFRKGFYLKIDEQETLINISLYGQNGKLYLNEIPGTFPYFDISNYSPGYYFLKIKTNLNNYVLQILKI